jgi:8-oxo-dGTP pyrophosphatase MutT (NUDIX family)
MAIPVHRKVRFVKNRRLFVVRTRLEGSDHSHLSTVGTGPWVNVRVVPSRRRGLRSAPAVAIGKRIVAAENLKRVAAGKKPVDLSDWGRNKKMRAVRIRRTPHSLLVEVEPRGFSEYLASQEESGRANAREFRGMVRDHLHGRRNMLLHNVHMLASGALVLIGDKYLVLPKRAEKARLYPDHYHLFAGYGEAPKSDFKKGRLPQPHQTTQREVLEEAGIKNLEFLGPNLKKARGKNPPALATIHNLESHLPYPDVFYLGRVPTRDPDRYIVEHFERTPDGKIVPKQAMDKWEMGDGVVIPLSSEAINNFVKRNSSKITPMALVALKALEETLKKQNR